MGLGPVSPAEEPVVVDPGEQLGQGGGRQVAPGG